MRTSLQVSAGDVLHMEQGLESLFEGLKPRVQSAMAEMFHGIVLSNLGPTGIDRPTPWAPLSNSPPWFYAQKVGRSYATLFETGLMASAIQWNGNNPDHSVVRVNEQVCEYAARHQYGDPANRLPARPFFPIDSNGRVTPFSEAETVKAAQMALEEELR